MENRNDADDALKIDPFSSSTVINKIPDTMDSTSQISASKRNYRNKINRSAGTRFSFRKANRRNDSGDIDENDDDDDDDERSVASGFSLAANSLAMGAARQVKAPNQGLNRSFPALIVCLGLAAAASFLYVGLDGANSKEQDHFVSSAQALVQEIAHSWTDYETAGLWLHSACEHSYGGHVSDNVSFCSRREFENVYYHILAIDLQVKAVEFIPNVSHVDRERVELEAHEFYSTNYSTVMNYTGFKGYEPDGSSSSSITSRSERPFYFPSHYVEPVLGNEDLIGFDIYSSDSLRTTLNLALSSWRPALTSRLLVEARAIAPTDMDRRHDSQQNAAPVYCVQLLHPGFNLTITAPQQHLDIMQQRPRHLSSMTIRINDLLNRSSEAISQPLTVYIYDTTATGQVDFLAGAMMQRRTPQSYHDISITFLPEISLNQARKSRRIYEEVEQISSSRWTIAIVAVDGTFEPVIVYAILGGTMIFLACVFVALWIHTRTRRQATLSALRRQADSEKAALIVENAHKAARNERELNDFIAHEVRNPLAAAMSACSFVSSAVNDEAMTVTTATTTAGELQPLNEERMAESKQAINEDLQIIDSSLHFINDLLRNMLDMQRAKSQQLNIEWAPVDILHDVLKPVDAMLYRRGGNLTVEVECPPDLFVMSDRLRLKQVALNLGRNALKFVEKGFVRLRAAIMLDGSVAIFIEDSGPGIPREKRQKLFAKFQESLDSLNQETGIGLCLCLNLVELMGGSITLDENYDSGVPGCPGARFVIRLYKEPVKLDEPTLLLLQNSSNHPLSADNSGVFLSNRDTDRDDQSNRETLELPESMSVLFVDDDVILRKLFLRGIKRVCPQWTIQEGSNGETAIRLFEEGCAAPFGLIFVDQYMASVEKQLLGTETVRALRAANCQSIICGLSANDVQAAFERSGANAFMFKPFPTKPDAMKKELIRILKAGRLAERGS